VSGYAKIFKAYVEVAARPPADVQLTEITGEVAVAVPTNVMISEITGEVAVNNRNNIEICEISIEMLYAPPVIHEVSISREFRITRKFPARPYVPGPCLPADPDELPAPGFPVPLECFFVAVVNPRDRLQVGIDWSNYLQPGESISSVTWQPEAGIVVHSSEFTATSASAVISTPGVPDGTDLLLACKITTSAGSVDLRRIKVSVRQQDIPQNPAGSWWRI
jgi:hypothetical protein